MIGLKHTHMLDKIDKINKVLLDRKNGSVDFWIEGTFSGKGEFPRIKIFKTEISVLILTNRNLGALKYWYETTY